MRTASGVLLIIVAVFNLLAAIGYLAGGAATNALGEGMTEAAVIAQEQSGAELTDEQKAEMEKIKEQADGTGVGFMAFGALLLVSVGILIAGAVFLFQNKKAQFIIGAGILAIIIELMGAGFTGDVGIVNILGLIAGIMAIFAARGMKSGPAAEPAE